MPMKWVLAFLLISLSSLAFGDSSGGLFEGPKWAFLVSAPSGWILDRGALRTHGIEGLFYKAGNKFDPNGIHIYISPSPKGVGAAPTLADFIKEDEETFMTTNSGAVVKDLPQYEAGLDYLFVVRDYDDPAEHFFQTIAYYEGDAAFFIFLLFCRSPEDRQRERVAFYELLNSFTYIRKE